MKRKKGLAFEQLVQVAVFLILIGVTFGMSVYINAQLQTTLPSSTITLNESETLVNLTWVTPTDCYPFISASRISNQSHVMATGNWTTAKYYGVNVTLIGDMLMNYTLSDPYNITYSCGNTTQYLAVENATAGVTTLAQWLPIMAIIIAAAVIIGLLIKAFAVRGGEEV